MWRPAFGFEGLYEVSDHGEVKRVAKAQGARVGRILNQFFERDGYKFISLRKDGKYFHKKIHHLVLESFGFVRRDGEEANHKDGVKTNNRLENLQWVTHSQNIKHAVETGLMPDNYAVRRTRYI